MISMCEFYLHSIHHPNLFSFPTITQSFLQSGENLIQLIMPPMLSCIFCSISMLLMSSNFPLYIIIWPDEVPTATVSPLKGASIHVTQALFSSIIVLLGFFLALVQIQISPFSPPVMKFCLFKAATHSIDLYHESKTIYFPSSTFNKEAFQSQPTEIICSLVYDFRSKIAF